MFEEDLFKFIPAESGIYENTVLIAPEQDSKHSRNFFGIIKTGDKCVHHSKLNPKQRRKIENISKESEGDAYLLPATADRIVWSDKKFDVLQLTKKSLEETPSVIKVTSNCSNFFSEELSYGQNLLLHTSGKEQRLMAYDLTSSRQLEIPLDLECIVLLKDRQLKIKEVLNNSPSPVKVKVVYCNSQVDDFTGHVFLLQGEVTSEFLVCSSISAGWVDQSCLLVIPEALKTEFVLGEGLRGGGVDEWNDFVGTLRRSVRHQLGCHIKGYHEIIVQEADGGDACALMMESKERLPCYENVEINLTARDDLSTLKPSKPKREDSRACEDSGIAPKCSPISETGPSPNPIIRPSISESNSPPANEINEAKRKTPVEEEKPHFIRSRVPIKSKKNLFLASQGSKEPAVPVSNSAPPISEAADQYSFPDQLEGLTCSEVEKCFRVLDLGHYCKDNRRVDGSTLSKMDAREIEKTFRMTPFDANKLSRFVRGWRP